MPARTASYGRCVLRTCLGGTQFTSGCVVTLTYGVTCWISFACTHPSLLLLLWTKQWVFDFNKSLGPSFVGSHFERMTTRGRGCVKTQCYLDFRGLYSAFIRS